MYVGDMYAVVPFSNLQGELSTDSPSSHKLAHSTTKYPPRDETGVGGVDDADDGWSEDDEDEEGDGGVDDNEKIPDD